MTVLAVAAVPLVAALLFAVPLRLVVAALVIASQVTAWRVGMASFDVFPEHLVVVALAIRMALQSPTPLLRRPAAYEGLLLAWVVWSAVTSLVFADDVSRSLPIVGWLFLAWTILWCARSYFLIDAVGSTRVLRLGLGVASLLGFGGFALWAAALLGAFTVGVQPEFLTGTVAAKFVSFEANLFGIQELFWLLIALRWRVADRQPVSSLQLLGLGLGIVASMTRAVWLASILLVVVTTVVSRRRARATTSTGYPRRPSARGVLVFGVAIGLVSLVGGPAAEKFRGALDFGSTTGQARLTNWNIALDDIHTRNAYVSGLGTNSYGQRHLSRTLPGEPDYLGNFGLTVLYDTGLIGVALVVASFWTFVSHGGRRRAPIFKVLFLVLLLMVGTATSPIWFGLVWISVAALDRAIPGRRADGTERPVSGTTLPAPSSLPR